MYKEIDASNEDVPLWSGANTEIPFITHAELSLNRLDEHGPFRPKTIDPITCSGKHRWQLLSPVVADLP